MDHDSDCFLKEERKSIASSILVLFGITQILIGAVLPLANSFSSASAEEEHENYMEIFFILQYFGCIGCLIYLIVIVHLDMKKRNQVELRTHTSDNPDHSGVSIELESKRYSSYENINQSNAENLLVEDSHMDENSEIMEDSQKEASKEQRMDQVDNDLKTKRRKFTSKFKKYSISHQFLNAYKHRHSCDNIGLDTEGISIYLRMGAVGFGFGVLMHDALKLSDEIWMNGQCRGSFWIPNLVVHFVYIFVQTYFLFKYHKIIFNTRKILIRYLLVQLMVTNICQWFKIVVFEITEELQHEAAQLSGEHGATTNFTFTSPLPTNRHILNAGSEPKLIGAVFYKLYTKVGQLKSGEIKEAHPHAMVTHPKYSTCHKSNKGFFFGMVLFLVILGAIGVFFYLDTQVDEMGGDHDLVMKIYMVTEMLLQIAALTSTLVAFLQMRVLPYRKHTSRSNFDDQLMFVGLAGIVSYDLFLFLPASESVGEFGWVSAMFIVKSLMEIFSCLFQALFIMDGNRRCSATIEQLDKKPGRSAVMFLFVTNLSMWLVNTFEVEKAETSQVHLSHYQSLTWNIVTHMLLPLIIFFRFHSTVCLSEIWSGTYKMKEADD